VSGNEDPILIPAAPQDSNPDPILVPNQLGQGKPDPRWAMAGKLFNPVMRTGLGFMSGGFVGGLKGAMDSAQMAAEPVKPQRVGSGVGDAFVSGLEGSSGGLLTRGRLPDVVLDPQHAKWYEKLTASAGQMIGDLPAMTAGALGVGALSLPTGPGAIAAGGAAAFAVPTAIREALTTAYSLDQVTSSGDFLGRVGIGIKHTAIDATVGALTAGTGSVVTKGVMGATGSKLVAGAAGVGSEVGVMTVAPAALEGRLPEPEDFMNAAILMGGMKAAHGIAGKLRTVYAKTGVEPLQAMAAAKQDPMLEHELVGGEPTPELWQRIVDPNAQAPTLEGEATHVQETPVQDHAPGPGEIPGSDTGTVQRDVRPTWDPTTRTWGGSDQLGPAPERFTGKTTELEANPKLQDYQRRNVPVINLNGVDIAAGPRPPYFSFHGNEGTNGSPWMSIGQTGKAGDGIYVARDHADATTYQGGQGQTQAIYVDTSKLVTFDARSDRIYSPQELLAFGLESDKPVNGARVLAALVDSLKSETNRYGGGGTLSDHLKSMGFNGVAFDLGKDGKPAWNIFDPRIIKNVTDATHWTPEEIARRQAFDPTPMKAAGEAPAVPPSLQPLASNQAAADAFPGTPAQAEQVLYQPWAALPETKLSHQLNMKYIEGPDDLRALETRMAEVYQPEIDKARGGTQTWAETEAQAAEQYAAMTGQELNKVMEGRKAGDTANAVELKIRGDMLMQATKEAAAAIQVVNEGGNVVTDSMKMDALAAIHRLAMIQADFTGASSELGRALNYLKHIKELKTQGESVQKLVELYGGDPAKLLEMAKDIDSPEQLARAARNANKAGTWDKIVEGWKAGLVSGPITHAKKFMGNLTFTAIHPLVDMVATAFSNIHQLASETGLVDAPKERMSLAEPLGRIIGNLMGVKDGLAAAREVLMDVGHPEQSADTAMESSHRAGAIEGMKGDVIRTPFRLLGADGALFRVINERGEAYALAVRQASAENLNPLTNEFRQRVAELAANPPEANIEQIQAFGERASFHAPMGETTQRFSDFVNKTRLNPLGFQADIPILKFIFPFIGTPANIFKEMARLTPVAPLVPEWQAAWKEGGVPAHQAAAELAMGTGISALVASLAMAGNVSGSGEPDPAKRHVLLASGWQPYSVKINNTWYSYQNFHPVGTAIGMSADMVEVFKHMTNDEQDKAVKMLSVAFSKSVTEQTFMAGLTTFVDAMSQPDRKGSAFIQKLAAGAVPNIIGQSATLMDPFKREIASIRDAVQSRIPGLREMLPPQRDPYGEPIVDDPRVGWISPVTMKGQSDDKVRQEAARLGVGAEKAPKNLNLPSGGTGMGKIELTPEQRDAFGDASGHMAYNVLHQMVNSPGWDYMPDLVKERAFKVAFERSNLAGKAAALSIEQRQAEVHRIVGEVNKRLSAPPSH